MIEHATKSFLIPQNIFQLKGCLELSCQKLIQGLLKVAKPLDRLFRCQWMKNKQKSFERLKSVGNLILFYKSKLEEYDKLKERWKKPKILGMLKNGAYKLEMINRKVLKALINREGLKSYHESFLNDFESKPS